VVPAWLHAPGERLRPQERHILDLIADGLTNRQIDAELYLAEKTVKNYVSSLLHKLGFSRRTEAVVYPTERRRAGHRPPSTPTTTGEELPALGHIPRRPPPAR
jgi:DNA-binding CsgD family transcriptional regulator